MTVDQLIVAILGMGASFAFGYVLVDGWARAGDGLRSGADDHL